MSHLDLANYGHHFKLFFFFFTFSRQNNFIQSKELFADESILKIIVSCESATVIHSTVQLFFF